MNRIKFCLLGLVFVFCSCVSGVKTVKSNDYVFRSLKEKTEYIETDIRYPVFKDSSLKTVNNRIYNDVFDSYKKFKTDMKALWNEYRLHASTGNMKGKPHPFSFAADAGSVYSDEERVSVCINRWEYSGGAHGNFWFRTYYYDRKSEMFLNASQASGLSFEIIQEECRKSLKDQLAGYISEPDYYDWMMKGTEIEKDGEAFGSFTFDGKILKIIFSPYSVGPYSCGAPEVAIDVKNYQP